MKDYAIRLTKGNDLKKGILKFCKTNDITSACVLSAVGCVDKLNIRLAKAVSTFQKDADYEIVSITGTIANDKCHIHCSFADELGNVIGGHLLEGCIVNTTCELVIAELTNNTFTREFDLKTGYDELVINNRK